MTAPFPDNSETNGEPIPEWIQANSGDVPFLDKLIRILTECNSAKDLSERVAGLIIDSTNAENASVMLYDGDSGNLVTAGAAIRGSRSPDSAHSLSFSAGEGIAGWVAENNIPVRLVDASKDSRFLHSDSSQVRVRSLFVHPISVGSRIIGVLNMSSSQPGVLGAGDERLVELVCRHLGKGIERASEVDRFRAKLILSETLLAAGTMLAGIAHEINNPLTTILGLSELMMREDADGDNRLVRINAEAARCVRIAQNVLRLGRAAGSSTQPVDVHQAILQTAELSAHQILLHNISLTLNLADTGAMVFAHDGELPQVFLNLMTNAIQAISSAHRPGNITISSAVHEDRLRIAVVDDGPGIRARDMERIFQPFFTTKQNGNGIGLSLSRKIIQDLGGEMGVSPNLACGATFTVELPLVRNEPELRKAGRSVLIVDDEEHIVDLVDAIVSDRGFKSTCCTKGDTALDLLKQNEYDLLICDYYMPEVGGRELMEWVRTSGRNTRVLVLSGDVIQTETRDLVEHRRAQFLPKPFGVDDLVAAVERTMER